MVAVTPGSGRPDRSGSAFTGQRIGEGQQRLGHAVALQHRPRGAPVRSAATVRPGAGPIRRHRGAAPTARRPDPMQPGGGTWWARRRTWCPAAPRPGSTATSKRSKTRAEAPAASVPNSPAHSPCTWKSGSARISRSSGCQPQATRSACAPANSERWVWTAPLGSAGGARGVHDQRVVIGPGRVRASVPSPTWPTAPTAPSARSHRAPAHPPIHRRPRSILDARSSVDQRGDRSHVAHHVG